MRYAGAGLVVALTLGPACARPPPPCPCDVSARAALIGGEVVRGPRGLERRLHGRPAAVHALDRDVATLELCDPRSAVSSSVTFTREARAQVDVLAIVAAPRAAAPRCLVARAQDGAVRGAWPVVNGDDDVDRAAARAELQRARAAARAALAEGRASAALYAAAARTATAAGLITEAASALRATVHRHVYERAPEDALRAAAAARAWTSSAAGAAGDAGAWALLAAAESDALLARGRYAESEDVLIEPLRAARRWGLGAEAAPAAIALLRVYEEQARWEEARALVRAEAALAEPAVVRDEALRLRWRNAVAYVEARALRASGPGAVGADWARLTTTFAALTAEWTRLGALDEASHARVNEAWCHGWSGDTARAEALLRAYLADDPGRARDAALPALTSLAELLRARGALEEAAVLFREARALAARAGLVPSDAEWRAALGLGRIARARGLRAEAMRELEHASKTLEAMAALTEPSRGHSGFLDDRQAPFAERVALARAEGRLDEALAQSERARAALLSPLTTLVDRARVGDRGAPTSRAYEAARRALAAVDAERAVGPAEADRQRRRAAALTALEDAWRAHAAALTAHRPPLSRLDVAALATRLGPREALRVDAPDGLPLWLTPAGVRATAPAGLARAYVVGEPRAEVPFALLPTVRALGGVGTTASSTGAGGLLVADPSGDLAVLRDATRALADRPRVTVLDYRSATRARVREALPRASWLVFAGHGAVTSASPWSAHLRLADDDTLTLADVLLAERVPPLVLLMACDSGRRAGPGAAAIGLAEAFQLAGARAVIAAQEVVRDEAAAAFLAALLRAGVLERPFEAFERARVEVPGADGVFVFVGEVHR